MRHNTVAGSLAVTYDRVIRGLSEGYQMDIRKLCVYTWEFIMHIYIYIYIYVCIYQRVCDSAGFNMHHTILTEHIPRVPLFTVYIYIYIYIRGLGYLCTSTYRFNKIKKYVFLL